MKTSFWYKTSDQNHYGLFILFYIFTILINYYTPAPVRVSYFLALLVFFYRSANNPFWIAFFLCLIYAPGYLFHNTDPNYGLPVFGFSGLGRDVGYDEVIVIVCFLKALMQKRRVRFEKGFIAIIVFSLFLFLVSFFWGISDLKIFRTIRFLVPYTLLWSLPNLLYNVRNMKTLFNYFLIFTIPIFVCQLYVFLFGKHIMFLLGGSFGILDERLNDMTFDSSFDLIRPLYSTHLLLLNVFYSLFLLLENRQKNRHVPLLLSISFLSFLVTGTRGYVIAASAMIGLFFIMNIRRLKLNLNYVFATVCLILLIVFTPVLSSQLQLSLDRVFTIQAVLEGDKTANGTLKRLTERQPRVMAKAEESLLVGFGFSDEYYLYKDGHVANATLLLNGGMTGVAVFIFFILYLFKRSVDVYFFSGRREVLAVIIGISGFLIVHSTSYMVFSFLIGGGNFFAFLILLSFANILFNDYGTRKPAYPRLVPVNPILL